MPVMVYVGLFFLGCAFLWKGANWVVRGSNEIGLRLKINPTVLGLTLVAFGTSAPELVVSVLGSLAHNNEIVFGNVIGSNVANTLLILGAACLIAPVVIHAKKVQREITLNLAISVLLLLAMVLPFFTRFGLHPVELGVFTFLFLFFLYGLVKNDADALETDPTPSVETGLGWSLAKFGFGCALLPLGGHFLIKSALAATATFGISQSFVSIFAIALGTSLPELVTTIYASLKKQNDLAVGNIVGSNIFNILFVLTVSGWIYPLQVGPQFSLDLAFLVYIAGYLWVMLILKKEHVLTRFNGIICLLMYVAYIVYCYVR